MLEKVVVAQGRHQNEADDTAICYVRPMDGDVLRFVDTAFAEANNGGILINEKGEIRFIPCPNPGFERDELINE